MASTSGTLLALVTYLICVSTILSLTFPGDVNQIILGQVHPEPRAQTTDFRAYSNISEISVIIESGLWDVSTTKGLYSVMSTTGWWIFNRPVENTIAFTDLMSYDSTFTNTYHILNPYLNDIDILVGIETTPFLLGPPLDYRVEIRDEGIKYRNDFYNTSKLTAFNITTIFEFSTGKVQILLEDTMVIDGGFESAYLDFGEFYGGGMTAYGNNTQLISLSSYRVAPTILNDDAFELINFLKTIAMLFFWTVPYQILPIYLNIIFIKIPLVALIFIIVQTFRGTG